MVNSKYNYFSREAITVTQKKVKIYEMFGEKIDLKKINCNLSFSLNSVQNFENQNFFCGNRQNTECSSKSYFKVKTIKDQKLFTRTGFFIEKKLFFPAIDIDNYGSAT